MLSPADAPLAAQPDLLKVPSMNSVFAMAIYKTFHCLSDFDTFERDSSHPNITSKDAW